MAESKDIEINQFPIVSSLSNKDYIVVSLDDGTQGRIKTSDLASVVAGVIGYDTTQIQYLELNTNLDNVFYNARSYINSTYTGDNPPYSPSEWCVAETIRFGGSYILQIVRRWWYPNQGKIRCYQNGAWGAWHDL